MGFLNSVLEKPSRHARKLAPLPLFPVAALLLLDRTPRRKGAWASAGMKRLILPSVLLFVGSLLPGCPIYGESSRDGCRDDSDCSEGAACDLPRGICLRPDFCQEPSDCGRNETCARSGRCVVGDCTFAQIGCIVGFRCEKTSGVWACLPEDSSGSGGTATVGGAGGADSGAGGVLASGGVGGAENAGSGG